MSLKPKLPIFIVDGGGQEFLSSEEAADFLRIKKSHLYNLTSKRMIKFYQPQGKLMYFLKADLVEWILNKQENKVNNLND